MIYSALHRQLSIDPDALFTAKQGGDIPSAQFQTDRLIISFKQEVIEIERKGENLIAAYYQDGFTDIPEFQTLSVSPELLKSFVTTSSGPINNVKDRETYSEIIFSLLGEVMGIIDPELKDKSPRWKKPRRLLRSG